MHHADKDNSGDSGTYEDLVPGIYRQRLVIEGLVRKSISSEEITNYLSSLSKVLDMSALIEPVTHQSEKFGWAGWIHWETSGAHFYAWDRPVRFFSIDIYTCKAFDPSSAIKFTDTFFTPTQIVAKEF